MKIIKGEKQVALILSEPELRYIANAVGCTHDGKVADHNNQEFPGTEPAMIGEELWDSLEAAVRANNKR